MEMLAAGVYDLGLTAAEFSSFTPRHIDAFFKRHQAAEDRATHRVALLCTVMMNAQGAKKAGDQPFTIEDFLPENSTRYRAVETVENLAGLTPEEQLAIVSRSRTDPEIQVQRIHSAFLGRPAIGKWTVDNG